MAGFIHFETTTTDENGTIETENDDEEDEFSDVDSFIDDNEKTMCLSIDSLKMLINRLMKL